MAKKYNKKYNKFEWMHYPKNTLDALSKEHIGMANKYIERCLTSSDIREIQMKVTVRYHHKLILSLTISFNLYQTL